MKFLIKLIILIIVVGAVLTYLGYTINFSLEKTDSNLDSGLEEESTPEENAPESASEPDTEEIIELTGCKYNADCTSGLLCIDGECGTIANLYPTDCPATCSITGVSFTTSDDEEYNLVLGQSGYTMAGALTWKLMTTPKYCSGETPLVPIKFSSSSAGKAVGEKIITLQESETSDPISHALAEEPTFTITLDSITEECG